MAAQAAGLGGHVRPRTLRHRFATRLLEQGVDIRVIQALLGYKNINTATIYTQVATRIIREVTSSAEHLTALMQKVKPPA